jgi:hypothetical protein
MNIQKMRAIEVDETAFYQSVVSSPINERSGRLHRERWIWKCPTKADSQRQRCTRINPDSRLRPGDSTVVGIACSYKCPIGNHFPLSAMRIRAIQSRECRIEKLYGGRENPECQMWTAPTFPVNQANCPRPRSPATSTARRQSKLSSSSPCDRELFGIHSIPRSKAENTPFGHAVFSPRTPSNIWECPVAITCCRMSGGLPVSR